TGVMQGEALWDMALQIGRRSLEALTNDQPLKSAKPKAKAKAKPKAAAKSKAPAKKTAKKKPAGRAAKRGRGALGGPAGGNLSPHRALGRYDTASARDASARARSRQDDVPGDRRGAGWLACEGLLRSRKPPLPDRQVPSARHGLPARLLLHPFDARRRRRPV